MRNISQFIWKVRKLSIYLQRLSILKVRHKDNTKNKKLSLMGKILTQYGEREKLRELFKVSHPTVRDALNGKTKSELSQKIRIMAMKRGAIEQVAENSPKIKII